jgi:alpha-galactosidase
VLAALAALLTLVEPGAAHELAGTWVPEGLTPEILTRQPQKVRVLVIREAPGGLIGKVVIPALAGVPVAVEQHGDRVRLTMQMARGMETPLDATLTADHLSIAAPDGTPPSALRRASEDERQVLERLAPAKLPIPAMKALPANGLARTPPMGFSTWNHFQTAIDDRTIRSIAAALVTTGMRDAGYVYVNLDDGWQGERDEHGDLRPNQKFPDMKGLADHLHGLGLKLGIYTSPGPKSCAGFEGSYGHEEQDARTFAAWGVDYLKYDWCSAGLIYDDTEMPAVYLKMAQAIRTTGRPMVFSICQYGRADVWKWGAAAGGHLWRTTGDIADRWDIMSSIGFAQDELAPFGGPGRWNDPDMLEVGNGHMTATEYRTHMSLWALLAAPLIAGHDVSSSSPETIALLTNRDLIAIDQDSLGRPGRRVVQRSPLEVWARPLEGKRTAVALFNRGDAPAKVQASFAELGIDGRVNALDVWAQRSLGTLDGSVAADVEPHGVVLLVLEPTKMDAPSKSPGNK